MDLEYADPVYNRLTDSYIAWHPSNDLKPRSASNPQALRWTARPLPRSSSALSAARLPATSGSPLSTSPVFNSPAIRRTGATRQGSSPTTMAKNSTSSAKRNSSPCSPSVTILPTALTRTRHSFASTTSTTTSQTTSTTSAPRTKTRSPSPDSGIRAATTFGPTSPTLKLQRQRPVRLLHHAIL